MSDLSRRTGLSHNTLQQHEESPAIPRIDAVEKLAKALEVSSDHLLERIDILEPIGSGVNQSIADDWGPEVMRAPQRDISVDST